MDMHRSFGIVRKKKSDFATGDNEISKTRRQ
jgi:hypothetical protein